MLAHQRFDADRSAFVGLDLASRFQRIHETNLWGATTSVSGLGSEYTATGKLQADLPALLKSIGVASLLDAPCGDASWIGKACINVDYIGVDIVPELIEAARAGTWPDRAERRFMVADITADNLPRADAVLCRDCLVHLSFENIARAVENFRRSGATWLITTTFSDWSTNADVEDGDWRALNFVRPPFSWPMPHLLLDEGCDEAEGGYRDKSLGIWRLRDIPLRAASIEALDRFSFGDSPEMANDLLALMLAGTKTATCWAARDGQQTEVGKRMVVCDGDGHPRAVLETTALRLQRFDAVDADFARKEGEGDLSLEWWRDAHKGFFARNGGFAPDMMLWCEEFIVVADLASPDPNR